MNAKSNLPEAWFAKADADLQAAELLLNIEESLVEIVCYSGFHSNQVHLKDPPCPPYQANPVGVWKQPPLLV